MVPDNNSKFCEIRDIFFLQLSVLIASRLFELTIISPFTGLYNFNRRLITVVFPEPEGPTKATFSPLSIFKLIFCKTM